MVPFWDGSRFCETRRPCFETGHTRTIGTPIIGVTLRCYGQTSSEVGANLNEPAAVLGHRKNKRNGYLLLQYRSLKCCGVVRGGTAAPVFLQVQYSYTASNCTIVFSKLSHKLKKKHNNKARTMANNGGRQAGGGGGGGGNGQMNEHVEFTVKVGGDSGVEGKTECNSQKLRVLVCINAVYLIL